MKLKYIIIIALLVGYGMHSQIIDIPDTNFKYKLVNTICADTNGDGNPDSNVDSNNDGEIQVGEAQVVLGLQLSNNFSTPNAEKIISLEGIQYFINILDFRFDHNLVTNFDNSQNSSLKLLSCIYNELSTIDVSLNSNLEYLRCHNNLLSSIDVTQNQNLLWLDCGQNQISHLDVTQNLLLYWLSCGDNQLNSLDVSHNLFIERIHCHGNQLSILDVSQNTLLKRMSISFNPISNIDLSQNLVLYWLNCDNTQIVNLDLSQQQELTVLTCNNNILNNLNIKNGNNEFMWWMDATENPNLMCIQVDDETATRPPCQGPPTFEGWCKDISATYSEECILGINDIEIHSQIFLYPNPVQNKVNIINDSQYKITSIKVFDILGKLVLYEKHHFSQIDFSELMGNFFLVNIQTDKKVFVKKIVTKLN